MTVDPDRVRWNRKYSDPTFDPDWAPDVHLASRIGELPQGRALDLACGIGSNALFLAKRGWKVDAIDISDVAIERLRRATQAEGVGDSVRLILGDVRTQPLEAEAYELVLCVRFLLRSLAPKIYAALKPGGVLLYRTYTDAHRRHHPGFREDFCLRPGELRALFADLEELDYEETDDGRSAHATLVARKRV